MSAPVQFGYKASAEQFAPAELLELAVAAEAHGLEAVAISDHFQPWRHHGGHSPAALPWLGAAGARLRERADRHERADPDAALPAGDRRAGVRHARVPLSRPRLPRRRHGRGDERDAGDRRRVAAGQGAPAAAGRGDQADEAAVDRGAGRLRGRLLPRPAAPRSTTGRRRRCRSTWPRRGRWRRSSPAGSATASSAPAARTRTCTASCSATSRRAPRPRAATPPGSRA